MFVKKPLVCCQASTPPPSTPHRSSGKGNVSCLQIDCDRLDSANLSFPVKTCQWHLSWKRGGGKEERKKKHVRSKKWLPEKKKVEQKRLMLTMKQYAYVFMIRGGRRMVLPNNPCALFISFFTLLLMTCMRVQILVHSCFVSTSSKMYTEKILSWWESLQAVWSPTGE